MGQHQWYWNTKAIPRTLHLEIIEKTSRRVSFENFKSRKIQKLIKVYGNFWRSNECKEKNNDRKGTSLA